MVEKYLWKDLTTLLAIYNADNTLNTRFNYAGNRVPYKMEQNGQTYYLAYNHLGSLRAVVDSNGTIVKEVTYDSFGNILNDSNENLHVNLGFAGGLYDSDTKLTRFGYRDYDAETGKWTAKDPIRFNGGDTNLYGYVLGDPVNFIDPFGLATYMCSKPLDAFGGSGSKTGQDIMGNPLYHQYACVDTIGEMTCGGQDRLSAPWGPGKPSEDEYTPDTCEKYSDNNCIDRCMLDLFTLPRPWYGLFGLGTNCQEWANQTYQSCLERCYE